MSNRPLLTVAIPAYNVELYLEETVLSIAKSKYSDFIEILIINDGSTDKTLDIANKLSENYTSIKVINKENGGHGSSINAGIKNASGKYFRLLDGDDWFDTEELNHYLEKLKEETADVILTDYVECFIKSNLNRPVSYYSELDEMKVLDLDEVTFKEWGLTLPTTTIKTDLLQKSNFKIDEHCFYVDQEYNLICYISAKTVKYVPLMIYQYRLEREGQSMERQSLIRNVYSHEKVCSRLLSELKKHQSSLSKTKQEYLTQKMIIPMCHMQYEIAINYCKSRKAFLSFDRILKNYPLFYNSPKVSGSIKNFHRKTNGLFIKANPLIEKVLKLFK